MVLLLLRFCAALMAAVLVLMVSDMIFFLDSNATSGSLTGHFEFRCLASPCRTLLPDSFGFGGLAASFS